MNEERERKVGLAQIWRRDSDGLTVRLSSLVNVGNPKGWTLIGFELDQRFGRADL